MSSLLVVAALTAILTPAMRMLRHLRQPNLAYYTVMGHPAD